MKKYTVELCFWNPEICTVVVEGDSIEDACENALLESDEEYGNGGGRTCYESCTETRVSLIAEGDDVDLYGKDAKTLPVPAQYADLIMCAPGEASDVRAPEEAMG
jgi:hypothetical protein